MTCPISLLSNSNIEKILEKLIRDCMLFLIRIMLPITLFVDSDNSILDLMF